MSLYEIYPLVRTAHISLVLVSGALFAARGLAVLRGAAWPLFPGVRRLSYSIDSALLAAALLLLHILGLNPFSVSWLATKISLLVLYIVLGSMALKRAPTPRLRALSLAAALLCFGFMLTVAQSHHPWGVLHSLQSVPP